MKTRRFTGEYAEDGKAQRLRVRAESGHRCIRCQHPFESGKHGKGEWSPCDKRCVHGGPARISINGLWHSVEGAGIHQAILDGESVEAQWRILTVHHLDGDKANDAWWNTLALCQRCHLQIQTKIDPRIPYFLEHSAWFKPYAAGFYASKYEARMIDRAEAETRMDELLAFERIA